MDDIRFFYKQLPRFVTYFANLAFGYDAAGFEFGYRSEVIRSAYIFRGCHNPHILV